jgi:hypothetical protein
MVRLPKSFPSRGVCIVALLLLTGLAWTRASGNPAPNERAVVAIGDVHGDFDDFVAILQQVGLIDAQHHWTGGQTTLVQVGDQIDRGPKPRDVMDLMMALEKEAPKTGGRVVSLLGNHEMMNLMGDLRYVTPENFASFADSKSEEREKSAFQQYMKWRNSHRDLLAELPQPMELTEAEWMARHPAGYIEQREAFSPDGVYGKWVRKRAALSKIGGSIFLHGGIHPDLAKVSVDKINDRIRDEIKAFDDAKQYLQDQEVILPFFNLQEVTAAVQAEIIAERKSRVPSNAQKQARLADFLGYGNWLSVSPDGPLWFRGYDQWTDDEGSAKMDKLLKAYDVQHIVVGHTVQKGGRVRPRFSGKAILIDTGMLASYYIGGRASALAICGDVQFTAEYMDQQTVLFDSTSSSPEKPGSGVPAGPVLKPSVLPSGGNICPATSNAPQ